MRYYEITDNGYVLGFGKGGHGGEDITIERYEALCHAVDNMPQDTETVSHRLKTDLAWEAFEIEPVEEDPTAEELLDVLLGEDE